MWMSKHKANVGLGDRFVLIYQELIGYTQSCAILRLFIFVNNDRRRIGALGP